VFGARKAQVSKLCTYTKRRLQKHEGNISSGNEEKEEKEVWQLQTFPTRILPRTML
jgi:hypothetical protein